ncbi:MAG TPA: hypothetical protein ENI69_09415 [Rhodospirillales bacterium]|nr:hypothetical protein [Rhodospirillales bacterium]
MPRPEDETIAIMVDADKIASLISTARSLLAENKMVDLHALQGKVADLCKRFGLVPRGAAEPFRATIKGIIGDLDMLATDLARQNEKVRLAGFNNDSRQATDAYKQND